MSPADPAPPGAPEHRRVGVTGGVELAVLTRNLGGQGTPMLLVHGLASNARLWDGVAERLAAGGHPVVAVDQRGHGRSDKPDDGYDFATLVEDLAMVLAGAHIDEPVLAAGQSWGGNVVLELAAQRPELLVAAALVDGGTIDLSANFADWPTCQAALTPPALAGTEVGAIEDMLRRRHADWPETGIAGMLGNFEVLADGTVRPWLSLEHHLTILRGLWEHHPEERYPLVKVPTILIPAGDPSGGGSRSEITKRDQVGAARAGLAQSAVAWIDGDHDLHAQHPGAVADLLSRAAEGALWPSRGSVAWAPPRPGRGT